ncbi:cysteine methyltransferase [Brevundimonas sp. MYb46]|nr:MULTISPECIES: methylated-DNA--[protein]-cysteine S-methyltransferase [unclassified Brevundimonas]PQZ84226.1 cysteine methyltransferase [Brevundimonas sp. MYb31]PRA28596.1 cysteine methyltransferase [Brevundimonas sp. MYb27]PRB36047.1 cysteine methyltransferase [Brevundimonas sp. MYb46]PRB18117.1 cysteine methyltransferase [Brevundimonas sp. MYb52]PRB56193.1 cysteine methyltransferase [Brevundimonas sp. MYb33]
MSAVVDPKGAVVRLDFEDDSYREEANRLISGAASPEAVAHVALQLAEYFDGRRRRFDVDLAPQGSAFLQRAWRGLRDTPYGSVLSYGDLARRMEPSSSARAVGRANALNPLSILIPCHRILSADGQMTGYSGGPERKQALLAHENAHRLHPVVQLSPFLRPP